MWPFSLPDIDDFLKSTGALQYIQLLQKKTEGPLSRQLGFPRRTPTHSDLLALGLILRYQYFIAGHQSQCQGSRGEPHAVDTTFTHHACSLLITCQTPRLSPRQQKQRK
jgi:hypothetical protein